MTDELKNILIDVVHEVDAFPDGASPSESVEAIAKLLRCDNCKHVDGNTCDHPKIGMNTAGQGLRVAPDFFCALFEPKCRSDENQTAGESR